MKRARQTTVGPVSAEVLAFTAGQDARLDLRLVSADCLGTAAHVAMLAQMPMRPRLFSEAGRRRVVRELVAIMRAAARGRFAITLADQDVHLAVERVLTRRLGDLGKRVHTGRSRNDQVAVDLRLYGKEQLLAVIEEAAGVAGALLAFGRRHARVPMVGRTHMQPAMPSSVGLWATSHAESLLDDMTLLRSAYDLNDRCPLGAAAGYGVPLPMDRQRVSDWLGFAAPQHNVLYAVGARGKLEGVVLAALTQVMMSLARLAEDLILFTMPEFAYFDLPAGFCTGSSIMPQKRNPDVLELLRARASTVAACLFRVLGVVKGLPSGYNRDVQETKEPFLEGLDITRASLRIAGLLVRGMRVREAALRQAFTPAVFATDRALEWVAQGVPFRDAYRRVRETLDKLDAMDPDRAIARKTHAGAPAGLDFQGLAARIACETRFVRKQRARFHRALSRLLGVSYPP